MTSNIMTDRNELLGTMVLFDGDKPRLKRPERASPFAPPWWTRIEIQRSITYPPNRPHALRLTLRDVSSADPLKSTKA